VKNIGRSKVNVSLHGTNVTKKYNIVRTVRITTSKGNVWNNRNNIYKNEGMKRLGIKCTTDIDSKYILYMCELCITPNMVKRLKRTKYLSYSTTKNVYGIEVKPVIYGKQVSVNKQCTVRTHPRSVQVGTGTSNIVKMYYVCKCAVTLSICFGCKKSRSGAGCRNLCKNGHISNNCGERCKKCMATKLSRKYIQVHKNIRRYARVKESCRSKVSKKNVSSISNKNLSVLIKMSSVNEDKSGKVDVERKVMMDGGMETDKAQQDVVNGEYSSDLTCSVSPLFCPNLTHCYSYVVITSSCTGFLCYNPSSNCNPVVVITNIYNLSPPVSRNNYILELLYIAVMNMAMLVIESFLIQCHKILVCVTPPSFKRVGTYRSVTPTYVVSYPGCAYSVLVIGRMSPPVYSACEKLCTIGCNCCSRYRE
jgi:hypothetical protein